MKNDSLFKILSDNLDSIIFIIDKDFKFKYGNKQFQEVINKDSENIIDQHIEKIADFLQFLNKNNRLKLVFETGKKIVNEEKIEINSDKIYAKITLLPVKNNGIVNEVIVIIENISRVIKLTKKIKTTDQFINSVLNTLRVYSIILTDKNGKIIKMNKGAELIFELNQKDIEENINIKDFFPPESIRKFNEIINSLQMINLIRREIPMLRKNGEKFFADLTISKMVDSKGETSGYLYMASDISEQIKLKENIEKQNLELVRLYNDMQKANKAKSIFLANMSHELRTPLTAILGFTELILDEKVGPLTEAQKEFLNDILSSGKHLLELINDILDLSKIEAERMEITIQKVVLQEIIMSAKMFIVPLARKKNIKLIDEFFNEELIIVKADESRLKQILYNLYSNAVKFTPENGSITTIIKRDDNYAYVSVKDTGIGIKPEDQKLIFEEFVQIENPYSKKYAGTGLGLSLVKKFLEMMKGDIEVFSEGEGKGTTFTFKIPLYKEEI